MAEALPYRVPTRRDLPQVRFDGDAETIRFLVPSVYRDDARGVREMRVAVDRSGRQPSLVVDEAPWDADATAATTQRERHVLIDRLASAAFSYYGANPPDSAAQWHREWRDAVTLPDLIRLELRPDGAAPWPAVSIAPAVKREDR